MDGDGTGFTIRGVRWNYKDSNVLTGNRNPTRPFRHEYKDVSVKCESCSAEWVAQRSPFEEGSPGSFTVFLGGMNLWCGTCGQKGKIETSELDVFRVG